MEYVTEYGVRLVNNEDVPMQDFVFAALDALDIAVNQGWNIETLDTIYLDNDMTGLFNRGLYNVVELNIKLRADSVYDDFTIIHELAHHAHYMHIGWEPGTVVETVEERDTLVSELTSGMYRWKHHDDVEWAGRALRAYSKADYFETVADIASHYLAGECRIPDGLFELYDEIDGPPLVRFN